MKNVHMPTFLTKLFFHFQALMPFISSPTFSLLYRSTVNDFPQAFLFVMIGVFFIIMILVMAIRYFENKAEKLRNSEVKDKEETEKLTAKSV